MTTKDAVYVALENWVGLYVDDKLVAEGESIPWNQLLEDGPYLLYVRNNKDADQNYVDNDGGLPETWDGLMDNQYMWDEDHRYEKDEDLEEND